MDFFFLEKYNAMAWHKNLANAMAPRNLQHKLKENKYSKNLD